jgi:flagellar assembly factor FliW
MTSSAAMETMIDVHSELLGTLTVPADELYTFATGLFGFADCRRFVLVDAGREGLFWLQSVEVAGLAFLLADPFLRHPGYAVDFPDADLAHIDVTSADELLVLVIVTLAEPPRPCTANLQAPLALNVRARRARQVVLADERYGVRAPITLA